MWFNLLSKVCIAAWKAIMIHREITILEDMTLKYSLEDEKLEYEITHTCNSLAGPYQRMHLLQYVLSGSTLDFIGESYAFRHLEALN